MEKLHYEEPALIHKERAFDYLQEFELYNSDINGCGGLDRYKNDYAGWLLKLEEDYTRIPNEEKVPARTYFLIRDIDDKIIGMINIRLVLNERLKKLAGNIGYSIRPTERRKGYNKINLYLGLKVCQEYGLKEVLLDCDKDNLGSAKTIQALGGKLIKEWYDDEVCQCMIEDYIIDVNASILKYQNLYEAKTSEKVLRKK